MTSVSRTCRPRPWVDVALAAGLVVADTALTLAGGSWWPRTPDALAWTLLALQALVAASLAVRRRFPLTVVGLLAGFTLLVGVLAGPLGALAPAHPDAVWAPYATVLAAYTPVLVRRKRGSAPVAIGLLTLVAARPWQPSATVVTIALLRTAIGPLVALYVDARRRLLRALVERAERAERDRDLRAAQARADERARLAAEMHDAVTHQVSLMVLQAGALRVTATDDATREAAERVRAAGCRALDELRDLVGVLHAAPGSGQPPTADLSRLVDDATAAGTPIDLTRTGDPSQASPLVGRTIHRVVREALTNARKHAPGSTVSVRVDYQPAQVRVTVRNTAPTDGLAPDLAATGSGLGLTALRRRVETVHGTLTAGPTADGGYLVEAALPTYVPTPGPVAGELAEPEPTGTC